MQKGQAKRRRTPECFDSRTGTHIQKIYRVFQKLVLLFDTTYSQSYLSDQFVHILLCFYLVANREK